jgi:membrane protease YdiL (CAAX protease family)
MKPPIHSVVPFPDHGTRGHLPLRPAPGTREMALVAGLAFFLNLSAGSLLQLASPRLGLVISEVLFIAAPAVLGVRLFYLDAAAVLPLRLPALRVMAGALIGSLGVNHLLTIAGSLQESLWPTPMWAREIFDRLLVYRGPLDFAGVVVTFAIVPAVAEEVLFRGFLQSGLARLVDRRLTLVCLSALVFGIFHLDPWRFAGVAGLGLFLAWVREAGGSLLPAMAAHAASNLVSIALKASGRLDDGQVPGSAASIGLAILAVIVAVLLVSPPRRPRARVL